MSNIRFWNICTFVLKQSSPSATFTASKFTPLLKDHTKFTNKAKTKSKLLTKSKVFSLFFLPRNHHKPYKQRSINKTKPHLLPSSTSSLSLSTQKTHKPLKQQYITTPPCPWMSIFSLSLSLSSFDSDKTHIKYIAHICVFFLQISKRLQQSDINFYHGDNDKCTRDSLGWHSECKFTLHNSSFCGSFSNNTESTQPWTQHSLWCWHWRGEETLGVWGCLF